MFVHGIKQRALTLKEKLNMIRRVKLYQVINIFASRF